MLLLLLGLIALLIVAGITAAAAAPCRGARSIFLTVSYVSAILFFIL